MEEISHPLVCYDRMTGDLIKIQLRDGTKYSCTGVVDFLQPVLDEYLHDYLEIPILLRGDSGFSTPDLYKQCEENGTSYVIRLKENGILRGICHQSQQYCNRILFLCIHICPFVSFN